MSLRNEIRNLSKADSRRFAKGAMCFIVKDPIILGVMYKHGIVPPGLLLNDYGFDTTIGKFFAMSTTLEKNLQYFKQIAFTQTEEKQTFLRDPDYIEARSVMETKQQKEMILVDFLRQNLILLTVPASDLPNGAVPDGDIYNVIVETLDIGQTMTCKFVTKGGTITKADEI